ncbi:unnamed protein product [Anisakis simplex]|uniref:F-box domain-containing protein n=1 Tax=Anisakis simplex TaxID=6269 RepID=A0A0M3K2R8_ANISI|nr:unnamed protein product [Anisakis simplex]
MIVNVYASFDGSGLADQEVWIEYKDNPVNFNIINEALQSHSNRHINSTLQLEIVRAEEEIRRGRMSVTLWAHQVWALPERVLDGVIDRLRLNDQKQIKLQLDRSTKLALSPQAVFKNALYFKEHHTPSSNTILHVRRDGVFSLHSKFTLDIPCVRIVPMKAVRSFCHSMKAEYIEYPLCGREITLSRSGGYRSSNDVVCEMRFGSYIRDRSLLHLDWAFNAIDGHSSPCSNELVPHCLIQEIQTFRRETEFVGEEFDELIACFLLSYRTADRWGGA